MKSLGFVVQKRNVTALNLVFLCEIIRFMNKRYKVRFCKLWLISLFKTPAHYKGAYFKVFMRREMGVIFELGVILLQEWIIILYNIEWPKEVLEPTA